MTIRPANYFDARAIAEILHSLEEHPNYRQIALEVLLTRVQEGLERLADRTVLVAVIKNQVLGFVVVHWLYPLMTQSEGYIGDLFVHASSTGQGLGSALLSAVVQEAKSRGCSRLALSNWRNRISYQRSFYAKHGFQEKPNSARFSLNLEEGL
jgi:GNAT superfamily N-acetyltransferase